MAVRIENCEECGAMGKVGEPCWKCWQEGLEYGRQLRHKDFMQGFWSMVVGLGIVALVCLHSAWSHGII